jgi:hypothetical protein
MEIESLRPQGIPQNNGRVGKSPLTTVGITKNYSSAAHDDPGDSKYSFIAWFTKGNHS